jgi:hypothetical protein
LKELEDHTWFPAFLRQYQTDFIGFSAVKLNAYSAFVKHLCSFSGPREVMADLCSGSGEPAITIFKRSHCFNRLLLSDKFPPSFFPVASGISFDPLSRDVLKMEFEGGRCYTMFNAFHHFSDAEKLLLVKKVQASGSAAFFVEVLEPGIASLFKVVALTTLGCLAFTPFLRPFSWLRLLLTYVIPVNVCTISFDGVVSVIKSRTEGEYRRLFSGLKAVRVFRLKSKANSNIVIEVKCI